MTATARESHPCPPRTIRSRRGHLALAAGLLGLAWCGLSGCSDRDLPESDIPVVGADQIRTRLDALGNKPVLVNLWAMWCPPCVKELPDLNAAAVDIREAGGEVVALNMELMAEGVDARDTVRKLPGFLARRELDLQVWMWSGEDLGGVYKALGIEPADGIPVTLAINAHGRVVASHVGQLHQEDFAGLFDKASR